MTILIVYFRFSKCLVQTVKTINTKMDRNIKKNLSQDFALSKQRQKSSPVIPLVIYRESYLGSNS